MCFIKYYWNYISFLFLFAWYFGLEIFESHPEWIQVSTWVCLACKEFSKNTGFSYFCCFFHLKLKPTPGNIPTKACDQDFGLFVWFVCLFLTLLQFSPIKRVGGAVTELSTWDNFIYRHAHWGQSGLLEDLGEGFFKKISKSSIKLLSKL